MTNPLPTGSFTSRFKAGEAAAFDELLSLHRGAVYGYLRARLPQASEAEELTQDVFQRFYAQRGSLNDDESSWRSRLQAIARELLIARAGRNAGEKTRGWTVLCLDLEDMSTPAFDGSVSPNINTCLEELGSSARDAISLKYRGNLDDSAIAGRLRRSESAVKLLLLRARQALRHCLEKPPSAIIE